MQVRPSAESWLVNLQPDRRNALLIWLMAEEDIEPESFSGPLKVVAESICRNTDVVGCYDTLNHIGTETGYKDKLAFTLVNEFGQRALKQPLLEKLFGRLLREICLV